MSKTQSGNYFEDFTVGQVLVHATPRTITSGDVALYNALYGNRFALQSSDAFAQAAGLERSPVDDLLLFHFVFGKTVPDISLNAVANLGYADCRFLKPVFTGDTVRARTEITGLKQNSNGKTGVVYVRTTGLNQRDEPVLTFARWVMVRKRDEAAPAPVEVLPDLADLVTPDKFPELAAGLNGAGFDLALTGSAFTWDDYEVGEKIDHVDGVTLEEAEHQMATRLYQNTAKVHFNQHAAASDRFGRRLIYGGVVISVARAISFNGLANVCQILAINGGRHIAPAFAGDTIYAWSEVLDRADIHGRSDFGAIRLRLVATKDRSCVDFPLNRADGKPADGVLLELDYWGALPRITSL